MSDIAAQRRYVAVVGSGPAGFFATDALLKNPSVEVHLFERLAAPFGLVRYGVAPDHQKIKAVARGFVKTAQNERVKFFGNVLIGKDITARELAESYDQVVYATGCEAPRKLGVPGEELPGVHSALAFVSWYNGHPDYVAHQADLRVTDVVVVGAGDVSMDVSRLLLSSQAELGATDMPNYALAEFANKDVKRVHVLIRRGPGQANFAVKELRAVVEREGVKVTCDMELLSEALAGELPNQQRAKLEYLKQVCERDVPGDGPEVRFHFLRSPVEFSGDGKLAQVKLEHNELQQDGERVRAVGTGQFSQIDAQLALLAVGYRGVAIEGVPFDERNGLMPNQDGRVTSPDGKHFAKHYVVGWLKRGPQGVIGTNKGDAKATVEHMLADLDGVAPSGEPKTAELLERRDVRYITFADWERLDKLEVDQGSAAGKPREKLTSTQAALAALSGG